MFIVAGVLKANDLYLIVGGLFGIAAAISELGLKVRNLLDQIHEELKE